MRLRLNSTLIILLFLYANLSFSQTCFPNGYIFDTQYKVDNFSTITTSNCTQILGDVTIEGSNITNLNGLTELISIGGQLRIENVHALENLSGLENLESIGNHFTITDCLILNDISHLGSLQSVGNLFNVYSCPNLTNFVGLESLTTIGASLQISGNSSLLNFEGLNNLSQVSGIYISDNDSLLNLSGLTGLQSVQESLYINIINNNEMIDLTGLESLTNIGELSILENEKLSSLMGLNNLNSVKSFSLRNHTSLKNVFALQNLQSVDETLWIDNNDSLINLTGLENLQFVGSNLEISQNDALIELTNFDNLMNVGQISLRFNDALISIEGFSSFLPIYDQAFFVFSNTMTAFPDFENVVNYPGSLFIRSPFYVDLSDFQQLQTVGGYLTLDGEFESLIGLGNLNTVADDLIIEGNFPNLEGLENLSHIGGEFSLSNNDFLVNLIGAENLITVGENLTIVQNEALISLTGIESLESIGGLDIQVNNNLTSLQGIENADLSNITQFYLLGNPILSFCNQINICNFLDNPNGINPLIGQNSSGCNSMTEILNVCEGNLSKVQFNVFYDLNQNQIRDIDEPLFSGAKIFIDSINGQDTIGITAFTNSINGGVYFLENGEYSFEYVQDTIWGLTTDSISQLLIDTANLCDTISFGLFPFVEKTEAISYFISPPNRCAEIIPLDIYAKNTGTTIINGTLWIEIDESVDSTIFVNIPDTVLLPNRFGWYYNNLFPSNHVTKKVRLKIPSPPNFMIGDSLFFESSTDFVNLNGVGDSSSFNIGDPIFCSYDPNDKLVFPKRNNNYTLFGEDLIYTIRFQNTGNAEAYNIVIRDTLDDNLDASTFRVLGTSHPSVLQTTIDDNKYLAFDFPNIYLPDSTADFEGSQGYVSYIISPNEGLPEETNITNTASIYFDFNPPIVTNTTENLMVSEIPISTHNLGVENGLKIQIFPNPASDIVFIKKENLTPLEYEILDVNGRGFLNGTFQNEIYNINFTKLGKGIYFIKLTNPMTQEFIIDKIIK